jgi:hypothetical protein
MCCHPERSYHQRGLLALRPRRPAPDAGVFSRGSLTAIPLPARSIVGDAKRTAGVACVAIIQPR